MLVGFALIAVAVLLCCGLFVTLSIYALPLFCGITVGIWTFDSGAGLIAALVAGFGIAVVTLATAHILIATIKSPVLRALVCICSRRLHRLDIPTSSPSCVVLLRAGVGAIACRRRASIGSCLKPSRGR